MPRTNENRLANDAANYTRPQLSPADIARIVGEMELESDDYESGPEPMTFADYYGSARNGMAGGFDMD